MKLTNYLGDKPFWKVAARLALPIAVQNMLTTSFTLVDTMMVSQLGDVALSSVGMAGQWGWLVTLLSFGLCSGMSVFVAQYWGVRDLKGIRRVMGMGIFSCLLLTLGFALVAACAPAFVIGLFNQDSAVLEAGSRYLRIVCISYPAVALSNVLSTVLRNTEQVKLPMYVSIFTTLANAVVNYGLIFGKLGMPELGVEGAAVATCISSWLGPVLLVVFSAFRKNLLIGPLKELFSFRWDNLRRFFQRALPVVINEGLWAGGTLILNMIYSNLGYEYYAGMTIFKTISDLAFASFVGLGNACVIMVGKSVGQGKIQRAVQDATRFTVLVPLVAAIMGLVVIACGGGLPLQEDAFRPLKDSGIVFWLNRDPGQTYDSLDVSVRPLAQAGREAFLQRYEQRAPIYRRWAKHTVANPPSAKSAAAAIRAIMLYEEESPS